MKDRCPENYIKKSAKEDVFKYALEWDNKTKTYGFPKQYGYGVKVGRRHIYQTDDKRIIELCRTISNYPYGIGFSTREQYRKDPHKIAHILWLAGVKRIQISHSNYLPSYRQSPENILMNTSSFTCYPYIDFPFTNGQCFLYWLLNRIKQSFGGGASGKEYKNEGYMQASWIDKDHFVSELVLYFTCLVDQFGDAESYYSSLDKQSI